MGASESQQTRKAALILHSLPSNARQRVMARLNDAERETLKPLMNELAQLGVSPALRQQLEQLTIASADVSHPTEEGLHEQVRAMSPTVVVQCLQSCAAVTVARLMRVEEWPWREQALTALTELRRAEVLRYMRNQSTPLAPAALSWMYQRLIAQAVVLNGVGAQPTDSTSASAGNDTGLRGFKQAVGRLFAWMR